MFKPTILWHSSNVSFSQGNMKLKEAIRQELVVINAKLDSLLLAKPNNNGLIERYRKKVEEYEQVLADYWEQQKEIQELKITISNLEENYSNLAKKYAALLHEVEMLQDQRDELKTNLFIKREGI